MRAAGTTAGAAVPEEGAVTAAAAAPAAISTTFKPAEDSTADWCGLDVAVVGGGPAGLSVALALLQVQPHLKIKVFEASPAFTQQGAGVGLAVNGTRALLAIDPLAHLRLLHDASFLSASYQYNDESGERMPWQAAFSPLETLERDGFVGGLFPWNSIRTALYASLPPGVVEFSCKVIGCLEPEAPLEDSSATPSPASSPTATASPPWYTLDVLRVDAAADPPGHSETELGGGGGVGEAPPQRLATARARFVIAADGYFSRVRRTAGDRQAPTFRGSVRWLGNITQAELESGRVPLPAALDTRRDPQALTGFHAWMQTSRDRPLASRPERALIVYAVGTGGDNAAKRLVWSLYSPLEYLVAGGETFPAPSASAVPAAVSVATDGTLSPAPSSLRAAPRPGEVQAGPEAAVAGVSGLSLDPQQQQQKPQEASVARMATEPQAAGRHDAARPASGGGGGGGGGGRDMPHGSVHFTGRRGARSLQRALVGSRHLPPELLALLAATPPERVMEFGLYTHGLDTYQKGAWAQGGLLLLGDAAHAGRADGQGANLAFEDAAVLGALVRQHGLGTETFAAWEEARQARVRGIQCDDTPEGAARFALIRAASFEPLWSPLALAPSLPREVAAEVRQAVERGGEEAGRQAVLAWCQSEMRRLVESQVAGRPTVESVAPPPGSYRFR